MQYSGITLRPSYTRQSFLQLATQRWRIKNLSRCKGGVTRLQLFSQLVKRTITNKMADALSRRHLEPWLAHSDKIALQVAEGMLQASNLSCNVAKSRGSFYFSCNSQRNNCSCKMGCYTWIFPCNLQRNVCYVASCKKNYRKVTNEFFWNFPWMFSTRHTIKLIGHHSRLRDVMDQSYLICAWTLANHARYSSVQVTFCGSSNHSL